MGKKKGKAKKPSAARTKSATARASANGAGAVTAASAHEKSVDDQYPEEATPIAPPPEPPRPTSEELTPVRPDPPTGSSERRLFRRIPFFRKIHYKFESMEDFRSEFANDISIGGMFIKTDTPEPIGSVVFLKFDLKDGSKILSGYGKVVRVNPEKTPEFDPGMGVEFLKFDEESLVRIRQLVAERFG